MYNTNRRNMYAIIMTIFLLVFVLLSFEKLDRKQIEERLEEKIELLGTEEFQLSLWKSDIRTEEGQDIEIKWWYNDLNSTYYFFLPSGTDYHFSYVFNKYDSILIDGERIVPGDAFCIQEGLHQIQLDSGEQIPLEVMCSENVNTMFMVTDSGDLSAIHESKQNSDTGSYILLDQEGIVNCSGVLTTIRGRGNMTFDAADKKSYAIRMEEKTAVLDLGIAKSWSLLANAFDESLARNQLVTQIAKSMDMTYVPDMDYVDLYINGEYQGNYQLAEKVEISDERLNIRNLEKEMEALNPDLDFNLMESIEEPIDEFPAIKWVEGIQTPHNYESGYLLELEMTYRYYEEKCGFISARKQPVVVKSPECVSFQQAYYLANKYQDLEDALCSAYGYNEETEMYYYDYLDMHSFAQKYLIDEISKNMDAAITSFFLYIPEHDDRFYAGPIWDYDRTFGVDFERSGVDLKDPCTLYVSENIYFEQADVNIFYLLCLQEEFQNLYKTMYFEGVRDAVASIAETYVDENAARIENSAMMDAIRCNSLSSGTDVEANREEYYRYNEEIRTFMEKRIEFLDGEWSKISE